eukprot:scaffold4068_cov50-Phaeocystis_antarctica.AAC.1
MHATVLRCCLPPKPRHHSLTTYLLTLPAPIASLMSNRTETISAPSPSSALAAATSSSDGAAALMPGDVRRGDRGGGSLPGWGRGQGQGWG